MKQKVLFLVAVVAVLASSASVMRSSSNQRFTASISDSIVSDELIQSVLIIDTETELSIGELADGAIIDISGNKKITFQAVTDPEEVGSVMFEINGKKRSDSKAPYAIYRDDSNGNFYGPSMVVGEYNLIVRAFTGPRATGVDGPPVTYRFNITDDSLSRSPDNPTNNLRVFLGGPYIQATNRMSTGLNDSNLIPLTEPYTALGHTLTSGAGSTISSSVLNPTGDDAIVDWIVVELRNSANPATIVASKPALVEADGDVMSTDGITPILGTFTPGTYYVAVHHRNHLAVMTANAVSIASVVDLSTAPLYGTNAAKVVGGVRVLWPGDVNGNGEVKYAGVGNDRDVILTAVGGSTPNNQIINTYSGADVNMNGTVKYTGSGNDRDPILVSVGGQTPNNIVVEQLPTGTTGITYYASPTGTGNGLSISSPFKINDFWSVAGPGATLILLDGMYTGANSMIDPPDNLSGTAGSPITVRAMNDGAVKINGQGSNKPVNLSYNNWFVLEGFDAYDSSGSVVSLGYSSNNIIRRVVAWKAPMNTGDNNIFGVHHGDNNLLEDVAGFGAGARKTFSNSQEGDNTTFRRAFARWEGSKMSGPKKAFALSYNSYGALCENCIGTWDSLGMPATYNLLEYNGTQVSPTQSFSNYTVQQPSGIFGHDGFDSSFLAQGNPDNANIRILGSIAYLKPDQRFHNVPTPSRDWAGPFALEIKGVQLENSVGVIEPGSHTNIRNPYLGDIGGAGFNSATNNTFVSTGGTSINNQWSTSNNYNTSSCSSIIANGGNVVNNLGITGGATVMKRYVDGVLTNEDLWPWPMNQRIINAMTAAGYASDKIIDVTATINGLCGATAGSGQSQSEIVAQAEQWLAASGAARTALEPNLAAWNTSIDSVIDQVQPNDYVAQPTGEVFNQQFTLPALVSKYPAWNDPATPATESYRPEFNMVVPPNYSPNTPVGLMFFLHWGGSFDPIELDYPGTSDPNDSYITEWVLDDETLTGRSVIRRNSDNSNYIAVAPIAPFGTMLPGYQTNANMFTHPARWDVPSADDYLIDIITEIASRYNIDYNKIVVTGTSMGGIGSYHMAHRLNDRLSAVMANGGAWSLGSWASLTDLPIHTIHGTNDAYYQNTDADPEMECRNHMTAVEFARQAHQLIGSNNPNDSLIEYPMVPGHGFDTSTTATEPGAVAWRNFLNGQTGTVNSYSRNPYRNHVIAINPWRTYNVGGNWNAVWNEDPSPHTMWLSINSYGTGTIAYNRATPQGDGGCSSQTNFNNWSLAVDTVNLQAGKAEATITGNTVNVTTNNVTNLSVWLHPNMVNFSQPITLNINGNSIQRTCTASLLTALKSYERRKDWNMIYTCELPININSSGVPI